MAMEVAAAAAGVSSISLDAVMAAVGVAGVSGGLFKWMSRGSNAGPVPAELQEETLSLYHRCFGFPVSSVCILLLRCC